ncbi:MAG: undecaprenyl-phosphate glucose phosphotransferase [Hyphomicrobium sp.]
MSKLTSSVISASAAGSVSMPVPQRRGDLISPVVLSGSLRAAEYGMITLLGFVVAALYVVDHEDVLGAYYLATIGLTGMIAVTVFQLFGLYAPRVFSSVPRQVPMVVLGWTIALALVVAAVFFSKLGIEFSRGWIALWYVSGAVTLATGRIALAGATRHWAREGRLYRRTVIYGANDVAADLVTSLKTSGDNDIRIIGLFDDRDGERQPLPIAGLSRMGGIEDLIGFSREEQADLVIVALPVACEDRFADVVKRLSVLPADIKVPAKATRIRFSPRTYSHVGSVAMIDLHDKPITDWGRVSKLVFDRTIAVLALVLLAPVMLVVAAAIKLDSRGPVLFRQKRYGFNNELIEVYKFRSMYTDRCDAQAARLVTRDDPRVTPVGRFIRKSSLDELPQLFNVLTGSLSLVGPRPHALSAKAAGQLYDEVVEGYFARHKVKPGITGWAQINGWRGETDTPEKIKKRVEHDLFYIENWSVFFDLYILLKTPMSLIGNKNAY